MGFNKFQQCTIQGEKHPLWRRYIKYWKASFYTERYMIVPT